MLWPMPSKRWTVWRGRGAVCMEDSCFTCNQTHKWFSTNPYLKKCEPALLNLFKCVYITNVILLTFYALVFVQVNYIVLKRKPNVCYYIHLLNVIFSSSLKRLISTLEFFLVEDGENDKCGICSTTENHYRKLYLYFFF